MSMTDWLEAEDAAAMLNRTERQLLRYATSGRVRTRLQGRRKQYHAGDVEQLAAELESEARPRPANVAPEVGRALVETLGLARELIAAQREIRALEQRVQLLEQQKAQLLVLLRRELAKKKSRQR